MYFLAMEITSRRFASTISFWRGRLTLSALHHGQPAEFVNRHLSLFRQTSLVAQILNFVAISLDEGFIPFPTTSRHG